MKHEYSKAAASRVVPFQILHHMVDWIWCCYSKIWIYPVKWNDIPVWSASLIKLLVQFQNLPKMIIKLNVICREWKRTCQVNAYPGRRTGKYVPGVFKNTLPLIVVGLSDQVLHCMMYDILKPTPISGRVFLKIPATFRKGSPHSEYRRTWWLRTCADFSHSLFICHAPCTTVRKAKLWKYNVNASQSMENWCSFWKEILKIQNQAPCRIILLILFICYLQCYFE